MVDKRKPAPLKALTGLRCFAAINIVLFHFSNPQWFGWFAPVVNAGYASVSYFILLSGFVMAYNYSDRAQAGQFDTIRYYKARFTRLYPIYLLSLLLAWRVLPQEWAAHTHGMFWTGIVLAPLLLQGWIPEIATFLNTPAWTMSAESFYYVIFPWMARWKKPERIEKSSPAKLTARVDSRAHSGTLYILFNPDGIAHPESLQLRTVAAGTEVHAIAASGQLHIWRPAGGSGRGDAATGIPPPLPWRSSDLAALFGVLASGVMPYALLHDGLLMPCFGCIILGLAGENPLAHLIGARPLVFVGEASYCLYLLHFNMWNLIHDTHVLDRLGLNRFDPWISYLLADPDGIVRTVL